MHCNKKGLKSNRKKYEKHSKFKLHEQRNKSKCECLNNINVDLRATIRWNERLNNLTNTNHDRRLPNRFPTVFSMLMPARRTMFQYLWVLFLICGTTSAADLEKSERFLDKINEQSIAAVFNKVAYGSTTKRSIPDNAYIYTTLATPLLTTYKYSDGNQEWYRVDVKEPEILTGEEKLENIEDSDSNAKEKEYGIDLEKDHVLPTSAPAADILKNNNNKNYNNPNRYNNDKLRPEPPIPPIPQLTESATEKDIPRTSTGYSVLRNVRPTKSMFGKDIPSYVPPSRSFFTPPLPPEYLNPFADKPTLRGTNSDTYQNRRPIPPPSLMPKKDRIPFRPDLPPSVSPPETPPVITSNQSTNEQRKKTLNTPSQNVHLDRLGEFYGLNRLHNESNFEYEPMVLIPSISRILSGSNGRKEDLPDILLRTVTAAPARNIPPKIVKNEEEETDEILLNKNQNNQNLQLHNSNVYQQAVASPSLPKIPPIVVEPEPAETTTIVSDILNLPNVKVKPPRVDISNTTRAASSGHEIWSISWNVHIYLVVFLYVLLAIFSIVKLVRFERENHMFSKSYFLAVHLLLTTICVLRIFYLAYDPYNINQSFGIFTYDILHNLPLSLLATTFAILIVFLLKRTLTHLKVKTRPVFLVLFSLGHMFLCFCLNLAESFDLFSRSSFWSLICRFVYILLCWSLGLSYVYLYKIIKNVLAKKSQNLSEMCSQNISYASHITIAIALLFTLLGFVQLYGLFFIKIDRFVIAQHWILWGWELSIRLLEISIITLLAIVVSLRMSQREKTNVGFPLFPCTTSDSSSDNIYPNNCNTNLNALNYSLRSNQTQYRQQQQQQQQTVAEPPISGVPEILDKKSTLERNFPPIQSTPSDTETERDFNRFERPNWQGSNRFQSAIERDNFPVRNFERDAASGGGSGRSASTRSSLKPYEKCRYYAKPKYDDIYNNSTGGEDEPPKILKNPPGGDDSNNLYSEPLDVSGGSCGEYERRYQDLDRQDMERRSRSSWTNSGRRSTGRKRERERSGRNHQAGVHTLPNQDTNASMLVDERGFLRFRQLGEDEEQHVQMATKPRKHRYHQNDLNHYSDA